MLLVSRHGWAAGVGLVLVMALSSCASMTSTVRDEFSSTYTCPRGRVTVTNRPDIKGHTLAGSPGGPPADVAADPERLALWKRRRAQADADLDARDVFVAQGCGHEARYTCYRYSDGEDTDLVACEDMSSKDLASRIMRSLDLNPGSSTRTEVHTNVVRMSVDGGTTSFASMSDQQAQEADLARLALALGRQPHPRLGASLADVNDQGLVVVAISPGGASDGKLKVGDVVVAADGLPVKGAVDFLRALSKHAPGTPLALTVTRSEETRSVSIDVGQ